MYALHFINIYKYELVQEKKYCALISEKIVAVSCVKQTANYLQYQIYKLSFKRNSSVLNSSFKRN